MKFFKQLSFFVFLAMLAFASCKKDEVFESEIEIPEIEPDGQVINGLITRSFSGADGLDLGCISIDYPFEMLLLDSTTAEVNSEDDFINITSDPSNYPIDFVYPLNVTDEDGNSLTANDVNELGEFFTDCIPNTGWNDDFGDWFFPAWDITFENSCYQLVYPVNLLDIDSMTVTANDEDELISLLSDGNIYSFAFPLDLEDEDGNIVTAEDPDELFELLAECGPGPGNGGCGIGTFACYELGYPATLLLIDGSTVVVNDDDEFAEVMMSGEWAGFEFPLTLIDEDGNTITVNSEDELHEAMLNCDPGWGGGGDPGIVIIFGCYDLAYPTTLQLIDGSTVVVNDEEELNDVFLSGNWAGFGYPLTLIDEDGNTVTVNNDQELNEALLECDDLGGTGSGGGDPFGDLGDFFCYDFSYPFTVTELTTGNEVTFNNSDEWETYQHGNPFGPEPFDFVYPFTLIDEDGNEVTVANEQEMFEAIEDCW